MFALCLYQNRLGWQWLIALFGAFCCAASIFLSTSAHAAVIEVDVVGIGVHEDIDQAQLLADDYAKRRALFLLARKWNIDDLEKKLSRLKPITIQQSIRGAKVLDFKREGNVLYTKAVVSVLDTPLKRALKIPLDAAIERADGNGILVVPVFKDGDKILVFNKSNPLRAPMRRAALTFGEQLVVVALGDNKDLAVIGADNILDARYDTFAPLLERYGAQEVVVALVDAPKATDKTTRVLVNRLFSKGIRPEILEVNAADPSNIAARYEDVARIIVDLAKKRANATAYVERERRETLKKQHILYQFTTMQEYGELERELRESSNISAVEVNHIALQEVEAVFYYEKDLAPIRAHLEKKGVKLREKGAIWVLSKR